MFHLKTFMVLSVLIMASFVTAPTPARPSPGDFLQKAVVGPQGDGTYVVPTTQRISPAGKALLFPGRPVDLAINPSGRHLVVKNLLDLVFVDLNSGEIRQTLKLPGADKFPPVGNSFHGIAWSSDGKSVWTTSADRFLRCATINSDGKFSWTEEIDLPGPEKEFSPKPGAFHQIEGNSAPGGFFLDEANQRVFVALSRNNSIGIVNLTSKQLEKEIPVGIAPFTIIRCGKKAYVSNWGGRRPGEKDVTGPSSGSRVVVDPKTGIASTGTVSVVDLETLKVTGEIAVGLHPSGMVLSPDFKTLYVANANSDTVSIIDTEDDRVRNSLSTKPMDSLPFGSAPNALAISPDGRTLYAANGGNDAIAVINLSDGKVKGLIPTGWYPGAVVLAGDGETMLVASTKGVGSRAKGTISELKEKFFKPLGDNVDGYNTHEHMGTVSTVAVPDAEQLDRYTAEVAGNMRLPLMQKVMNLRHVKERVVPVPYNPGELSLFKHVLYIIKENRTYDQILGDLPQGNGDPGLCHFPREVTPNHHALAEQFVLLDNFYCNGVRSADGHQWTDEGYVTDYLEKSFGGVTRSYPFDGDDAIAYASSGFIWDHVLAKGLSFRNYGEFVKAKITPSDATWADIYDDYLKGTQKVKIEARTELHTLEPYICPTYVGFPGTVQDVYRAESFLRELRQAEEKGEWYNFIIMLLPNDHTMGTREGFPTPRASVADNDLALGRIVEAVTKSRFWPETVIFVVQDDPQMGLDHVDGHRTVAFCISPYTKRGYVDSTHYNQTGMLRTMELIMGIPPLNQLDMASNPMMGCFQDKADYTPYTALPNRVPLDEMNPKKSSLKGMQRHYAEQSMLLQLDDVDRADEDTLNRIIWHSVKGYNTPYPKLARRPQVGAHAWPTWDGEIEGDSR